MVKFLAKLIGWIGIVIISLALIVVGVGAIVGLTGMIVAYVIPAIIGLFVVGSVLYVLDNVFFGD